MSTPFPLHNQSQEMGKKKAVLIGCNYPNTKAELKGCINDVNRIHRSLIDRFGFSDSDITILIDTDPSYVQPTGANVRQAIQDMIHSAKSGDYLFMHYSGHGVRLPPETGEVDDTGFDECIVPCDMNLITDDDFRDFVDEVPDGCRITIVSDSCHSGGLIDKLKEQIGDSTKHKEDEEFSCCKFWLQFLENTFQSVFNSGDIHHSLEAHNQNLKADDNDSNNNLDTDHMKNRSLPLHTLIEILKQKTGKEDIDVGKLRPTLFHIFGHDTSPKFKKFMKVILNELQLYGSSESTGGGFMGIIESLPHFLKQKLEEVGEDYAKPALETTVHSKQEVYAGANNKPLPNNGILISGCQTDETSADAYPAGGLAYGALSNAIQILLAEGDDQISNKELVLKARRLLAKQGFTQHPGLYCIDDNLDVPFVCP